MNYHLYPLFRALLFIVLLSSCGGYKQMATRWHYRNDFKLPKANTQLAKATPATQPVTEATPAQTAPAPEAMVAIPPAPAQPIDPIIAEAPALPASRPAAPARATATSTASTAPLTEVTASNATSYTPSVTDAMRFLANANDEQIKEIAKAQDTTNLLAIAGFVCGLVGVIYGGLILGIIGLILSILGYRREGFKGLAIAGIILSIIAIIGGLSYQRK